MKSAFLISILISCLCFSQNVNNIDLNIAGIEPSLAVNSNGNVLSAYMIYGTDNLPKINFLLYQDENNLTEGTVSTHGSDPDVEFDNFGNAYICYLDGSDSEKPNAVVLCRSIDGGSSFPEKYIISEGGPGILNDPQNDKPFITIDQITNDLYIVYRKVCQGNNTIQLARNTSPLSNKNFNSLTFSTLEIQGCSSGSINHFPFPIANGGNLIVFYNKNTTTTTEYWYCKLSKQNGQLIQSTPIKLIDQTNHTFQFQRLLKQGRINNSPAPFSAFGPNGTIYLISTARFYSTTSYDFSNKLIFIKSTDQGSTWNSIEINCGSQDVFFPFIVAENNDIYITFYDSNIAPWDNMKTTISILHSTDQGQTFTKENIQTPLLDFSVLSLINSRFGDYSHASLKNNKLFVGFSQPIYGNISNFLFSTITTELKLDIHNYLNQSTNEIGEYLIDNQIVSSGGEYYKHFGTVINSINPRLPIYGQEKFRNWRLGLNRTFQKQNELITLGNTDFITDFFTSKSLVVKNYFEGGNGQNIKFGEIGFDFSDKISPFETNAFVFQPITLETKYKAEAYQQQTAYSTTWNFYQWENGCTNLVRDNIQVDNNTPASMIAMYKAIQRSDFLNTFTRNNQRKVISTNAAPPVLFKVYESMGNIWLEKSTDNGSSWFLYPTTPLSSEPAADPSIEHKYNSSSEEILYIPYVTDNNIRLKIISGKLVNNTSDIVISYNGGLDFNKTPVASIFNNNKIFIVWKSADDFTGAPGLFYQIGTIGSSFYDIAWNKYKTLVPGTNVNSMNPTIESLENDVDTVRFAWEENNKIKYANIKINSDYSITLANQKTISDYTGYTSNNNPSLIAVKWGARLNWIGTRSIIPDELLKSNGMNSITTLTNEVKSVFMDPSNTSRVWSFGNNVKNVSINSSADCYTLAWSRGNSDRIQFTDSYSLSRIDSLNITGKDVQLSNGNDKYQMKAITFNSESLPYYFNNSYLYQNSGLKQTQYVINSGREGIIKKGPAQFYFTFGDVYSNGKNIPFKSIDNSTSINNYSGIK